jgi:hypothetical protein
MKVQHHGIISLTCSAVLFLFFRSWGLSLGCLFAGIMIDGDYLIDYFLAFGLRFKMEKFIQAYRESLMPWVRVFHSWEWVPVLITAAWLSDWNAWVLGLLAGFIQHIFADNINNRESVLSYSFIWRWRQGFETSRIFRFSHLKKE